MREIKRDREKEKGQNREREKDKDTGKDRFQEARAALGSDEWALKYLLLTKEEIG